MIEPVNSYTQHKHSSQAVNNATTNSRQSDIKYKTSSTLFSIGGQPGEQKSSAQSGSRVPSSHQTIKHSYGHGNHHHQGNQTYTQQKPSKFINT